MRPLRLRNGWIVMSRKAGIFYTTFRSTRIASIRAAMLDEDDNTTSDNIVRKGWPKWSRNGGLTCVKVSLFAGHYKG